MKNLLIKVCPATIAADDSELTLVANIRANEMADHGSLRYQGKKEGKHKRLMVLVGQLLMIQNSTYKQMQ